MQTHIALQMCVFQIISYHIDVLITVVFVEVIH